MIEGSGGRVIKAKTKKKAALRLTEKGIANLISEAAGDKKAEDIKILDLRKVTPLADFIVVCTGESAPQIKAIASHVDDKLRAKGIKSIRWEGKLNSNWMILDLGRIVVHIMGQEERERYDLESLFVKKAIVYHL